MINELSKLIEVAKYYEDIRQKLIGYQVYKQVKYLINEIELFQDKVAILNQTHDIYYIKEALISLSVIHSYERYIGDISTFPYPKYNKSVTKGII